MSLKHCVDSLCLLYVHVTQTIIARSQLDISLLVVTKFFSDSYDISHLAKRNVNRPVAKWLQRQHHR